MSGTDAARTSRGWGAPAPILIFAAAAHFLHHVLLSLYVTLVLVLTIEWRMDYASLIALWTIGSMMVGLGAPLAGWLADRWGETRVMIVLFFGLGVTSILCGLAQSPLWMQILLTLLGAFGAIYHPVGNSWVVHHATEPGRAVATAGIFGSFGVAAGPVIAGLLTDAIDWRAAFIVPGIVTLAFGVALTFAYLKGRITNTRGDHAGDPLSSLTSSALRAMFGLLAVTMTLTLIAYTAFATALPKFIEFATKWEASDLTLIGLAVGAIHLSGSFAQFVGGHFADKGVTRFAYSVSFVVLAAALAAASIAHGWLLVLVAIAAIFVFEMISPLETLLVARMAPPSRRGLFFGFRYALAVVGAPAGVSLVAALYDPTFGFTTLMLASSGLALVTFAVSLALPRDSERSAAVLQPATPTVAFQSPQGHKTPSAEAEAAINPAS